MPYEIRKTGPKSKPYCVYNSETGERRGCTPTRERAIAFMRALYHAESGRKFTKK